MVAIAVLTAACTDHSDRADLVVINGGEPDTLDPATVTSQIGMRVSESLFEGLTRFDKDGNVTPGVAESWEESEDGMRWSFLLRKNAKWSNGEAVNARSFRDAWERTLNPQTASGYAYQLYYIKNAQKYNDGSLTDFSKVGVQVIDDYQLAVSMERPTPFFAGLCATVTLAPVHVESVRKAGDRWLRPENMICNGAYMMESWRLNHRLRMRKNPHYWDRENVPLETIDVLPIADANTALNFFIAGQADVILDKAMVPAGLADELRKRSFFHAGRFLGVYFVRFNTTIAPFDDERVRRAFALAIDKHRIVENITRMGEDVAQSFVPPGTGTGKPYEPPESAMGYDPEKARALLAEAGYPDGKGFPSVSYLYNTKPLDKNVAVELQSMWKKALGVNVALRKQEWKSYLASMKKLDYQICRSSWIGDYNDPNTFLDMFVSGGGQNRTGWSHEEYDRWIRKAANERETTSRYGHFQEAEKILVDEGAPVAPIYHYVGVQFYEPEKIGGVASNLLDVHPFREIYRK